MSGCPFGHDSKNTLPDFSTALPVQVGLDHITRMFWEKYGSIVHGSFGKDDAGEKRREYGLQRSELKTFLLNHPSFEEGKLLDTLYDRAYQDSASLLRISKTLQTPKQTTALGLIHWMRGAITGIAEEILQPKNIIERRIVDNIMGPLAPWECTVTSIIPFYEQYGGTEVFTQAWKTITQVNALIGTHLATRHISSVVDQLVVTMSGYDGAAPYFLISGDDRETKMTWRPHAIPEIITQLDAQNWEKIIHDPETRKGPLMVCPAANVNTPHGTIIEMGVEKIGNVLLRALFS